MENNQKKKQKEQYDRKVSDFQLELAVQVLLKPGNKLKDTQ